MKGKNSKKIKWVDPELVDMSKRKRFIFGQCMTPGSGDHDCWPSGSSANFCLSGSTGYEPEPCTTGTIGIS